MLLPCDFCDSKTAVLYCRADSAKLCLLCDQLVHSANALSLKHLRSQICDYCQNDAASNRCSTASLMLCNDCVWNAHNNSSASSLHDHTPIEGFSGCPSIIELASLLGVVLKPEGLVDMVPNSHSSASHVSCGGQNLRCGKHKGEVYEQLMEMTRRNLARLDKDGAELGPGTPPSRRSQHGELESFEFNNGNEDELVQQKMPFTSLLMFPTDVDMRKDDCGSEGDLLWDCSHAYEATQVCSVVHSNFVKHIDM